MTMFLNGIVLLAAVCAVNAAVVISIYDNDIENDMKNLRCDYNKCDQRCIRMGYPSGACNNGICKCDKFKKAEVDDLIPVALNEMSHNSISDEAQDCIISECVVRCLNLGFPGGMCYDNKCECNPKPKGRNKTNLYICDEIACNIICQEQGYLAGICKNNTCFCIQ